MVTVRAQDVEDGTIVQKKKMLLLQLLLVLISLSCHHLSVSTLGPTMDVTPTTDDNNKQRLLLLLTPRAPAAAVTRQEHLVSFYQSFYRSFFPYSIKYYSLFHFSLNVDLTEFLLFVLAK